MDRNFFSMLIFLLSTLIILSPVQAQESDTRLEKQKQAILSYCANDTYETKSESNPNNLPVRKTAEGVPFEVEKIAMHKCKVFSDTGEVYKKEFFWTTGNGRSAYPENYIWQVEDATVYVITGGLTKGPYTKYLTPEVTETAEQVTRIPGTRTVKIYEAGSEERELLPVEPQTETKWIKKGMIKETTREIQSTY